MFLLMEPVASPFHTHAALRGCEQSPSGTAVSLQLRVEAPRRKAANAKTLAMQRHLPRGCFWYDSGYEETRPLWLCPWSPSLQKKFSAAERNQLLREHEPNNQRQFAALAGCIVCWREHASTPECCSKAPPSLGECLQSALKKLQQVLVNIFISHCAS
eukprot:m.289970 g.289970  ORF g.289970 m.289970 type:complete len:158 (-) comp22946_c1_seq6:273-746(-)